MCRSDPILAALRWIAVLSIAATAALLADRVAACPLSDEECAGVVRDVSELGGGELERLRRGERLLEIRDLEAGTPARITQIVGALVVAAPPDVAWAVITDFRSWPRFVPHLAQVELLPLGGSSDSSSSLLLRQDTRIWGFGFSATTHRVIDAEQRILWDQLAPNEHNDVDALSGFWQVLDLGDGRSLLRFQSRVALAASLPDALESWLVGRGAPDALDAFAVEIERRQGAQLAGISRS